MTLKKKNILITGPPGIGKTTLFQKLATSLKGYHPVGFYTEEIREGGIRKGFALASLEGARAILSHVDIKSPWSVSRYKVDIKGLEEFLEPIPFLASDTGLIMIDEIGKMESLSDKFQRLMREVLDSPKAVLATIAFRGNGFIAEVKQRDDVRIFEVTPANRERLLREIKEYLNSA